MTASLKLRYKNFCEFMENNTKGVEVNYNFINENSNVQRLWPG